MKLIPPRIPHRHDKLFRKALENPVIAKDFFNAHIPPEVKEIIDVNTLSLQNCSFIEQDLKAKNSDIIIYHPNHPRKRIYLPST